VFALSNLNEMVCMDRRSGAVKWVSVLPKVKEGDGAVYFTGPILAGNTLIITSSLGEIIRINPEDGKIVSTLNVGDPLFLSPIVSDKTLYVLSDIGTVHAFQ
jgi:outer membrane protein assembly factor BamB